MLLKDIFRQSWGASPPGLKVQEGRLPPMPPCSRAHVYWRGHIPSVFPLLEPMFLPLKKLAKRRCSHSYICRQQQRHRHRFSSGRVVFMTSKPPYPKILFRLGFRPFDFVDTQTTFFNTFSRKKCKKREISRWSPHRL